LYFSYVDKIPQLQLEIPRSGDVIGAGENKILAFFKDSFHSINYLNLPVGQKPSTKKSNVFSLVTREKTLESLDKNVPFPIATKPDQRFAYGSSVSDPKAIYAPHIVYAHKSRIHFSVPKLAINGGSEGGDAIRAGILPV
jgi:hypothetical protein